MIILLGAWLSGALVILFVGGLLGYSDKDIGPLAGLWPILIPLLSVIGAMCGVYLLGKRARILLTKV